MQPSLASSPSASSGTEPANSDQVTLNAVMCISSKSLCKWSAIKKKKMLTGYGSYSFIFSPGNFRIAKISGASKEYMKCFNNHTENVLSHQLVPPESNQALLVLPSTPTNLMSRAEPHRRASTFSANRIRSRGFAFQKSSSKTHPVPGISDALFCKDTRTEGCKDKSLSHLAPTSSETFLKVLELCLSLPTQMLTSALKTSWVH